MVGTSWEGSVSVIGGRVQKEILVDDPSRFVKLRVPMEAPTWLVPHLLPKELDHLDANVRNISGLEYADSTHCLNIFDSESENESDPESTASVVHTTKLENVSQKTAWAVAPITTFELPGMGSGALLSSVGRADHRRAQLEPIASSGGNRLGPCFAGNRSVAGGAQDIRVAGGGNLEGGGTGSASSSGYCILHDKPGSFVNRF